MYILIEHNGSENHLKFVEKIKDYLEDNWGATVEEVVGSSEKEITLYNEDLKQIVELSTSDDISVLHFYIDKYYED